MRYDARAAATANRLIAAKGQDVTLSHAAPAAYNTATSTMTPSSTTTQTVKAVEQNYSVREIDGTTVLRGDKKLTMTAVDVTAPVVDDTCLVGSTTYTVKAVDVIAPAGAPIVYVLQLRA